jgi:hypothetical protein
MTEVQDSKTAVTVAATTEKPVKTDSTETAPLLGTVEASAAPIPPGEYALLGMRTDEAITTFTIPGDAPMVGSVQTAAAPDLDAEESAAGIEDRLPSYPPTRIIHPQGGFPIEQIINSRQHPLFPDGVYRITTEDMLKEEGETDFYADPHVFRIEYNDDPKYVPVVFVVRKESKDLDTYLLLVSFEKGLSQEGPVILERNKSHLRLLLVLKDIQESPEPA